MKKIFFNEFIFLLCLYGGLKLDGFSTFNIARDFSFYIISSRLNKAFDSILLRCTFQTYIYI